MKPMILIAAVVLFGLATFGALVALRAPELPGKTNDNNKSVRLHNGWKITPAGAMTQTMGDTLMGCAMSPDGKILAVSNAGAQAHAIHLLDALTGKAIQKIEVDLTQSGLAWSPDGKTIYASGGIKPQIHVFTKQDDGTYKDEPMIVEGVERNQSYFSGLAISGDGKTVYIANITNDTLYAFDTSTRKQTATRAFDQFARPGCVRVGPNGLVYVAMWGHGKIVELDGATLAVTRTLETGKHPNDLLFSKTGDRIFVSCGNSDAVFVHDAKTGTVAEQIKMTLTPNAPPGATPSALALSPDGTTLYVANSDNNDVAVVDVAKAGSSRVRGFLPTAHYPTVVAVSTDGKRLFVGSGKGVGFGPNGQPEGGKIDPVAPRGYPYITLLMAGVVQRIELPVAPAKLAQYTKQVLANTPYTNDTIRLSPAKAPKSGTNPIPSKVGEASPIKHVLYIIKENRTYDQMFGDMTDATGNRIGNGDPNLCLFDETVSPNHHALARQYVLLDNTYCDGEVSVDGHQWSKGGYVTDFMQRTWPSQYGGKGRPPLTENLSQNPNGYIWENCKKASLSYRTYYYHTSDNRSEEWAKARGTKRDHEAVDVFINEFDEFEKNKTLPKFMVMALSEDHTSGTSPGRFTPKACVASNDYGLGKIVERLSKSPYWKEMAIFVIEDDAQNGPDHVDAHRTMALVISPYTRRGGLVDSTFYTTSSVLRTMELILGLPPMSQYDAGATPMYNSFTMKADLARYTAIAPKIDVNAKNPARSATAARMRTIDFSEPDLLTRDDEDALNRALWHSVKGDKAAYPGITRRALFPTR